jgi:hypothetical protein
VKLPERSKYTVPMVVILLFLACSLALINYYSTRRVDWDETNKVYDLVQKVCTIIAIIAGALWAYFNFSKGRVYRPSLEPKITGRYGCRDEVTYLVITAQLKNVGLSDFKIQQEGTTLIVSSYIAGTPPPEAESPKWKEEGIFSVFKVHERIEPQETVTDERLVLIPNCDKAAVKVYLRVVYKGIEWNTWTIIEHITSDESKKQKALN